MLNLAGCTESPAPPLATEDSTRGIDDHRIIGSAAREPENWLSYGQDYREQRFSRLTQITPANISSLGLAWHKPIGGNTERMQGTPLVADGRRRLQHRRHHHLALGVSHRPHARRAHLG